MKNIIKFVLTYSFAPILFFGIILGALSMFIFTVFEKIQRI